MKWSVTRFSHEEMPVSGEGPTTLCAKFTVSRRNGTAFWNIPKLFANICTDAKKFCDVLAESGPGRHEETYGRRNTTAKKRESGLAVPRTDAIPAELVTLTQKTMPPLCKDICSSLV